jgi:hypothetical protein
MQGHTQPLSNGLDMYKYIQNEIKNNRGAKQSRVILPIFYEDFCAYLSRFVHSLCILQIFSVKLHKFYRYRNMAGKGM